MTLFHPLALSELKFSSFLRSVHLAPVADMDNKNGYGVVFQSAKDTIVAYSVAPILAQAPFQRLAYVSRVLPVLQALMQEYQYPLRFGASEPFEVGASLWCDINPPSHVLSLLLLRVWLFLRWP